MEAFKKEKVEQESAYELVNVANEYSDPSLRLPPFSCMPDNPDMMQQLEEKTRLCKQQRHLRSHGNHGCGTLLTTLP